MTIAGKTFCIEIQAIEPSCMRTNPKHIAFPVIIQGFRMIVGNRIPSVLLSVPSEFTGLRNVFTDASAFRTVPEMPLSVFRKFADYGRTEPSFLLF